MPNDNTVDLAAAAATYRSAGLVLRRTGITPAVLLTHAARLDVVDQVLTDAGHTELLENLVQERKTLDRIAARRRAEAPVPAGLTEARDTLNSLISRAVSAALAA